MMGRLAMLMNKSESIGRKRKRPVDSSGGIDEEEKQVDRKVCVPYDVLKIVFVRVRTSTACIACLLHASGTGHLRREDLTAMHSTW